ncbi:hypothetical protein VQ056_23555 [Paenibacillus sp. JTLBN-2024]
MSASIPPQAKHLYDILNGQGIQKLRVQAEIFAQQVVDFPQSLGVFFLLI